MLHDKLAEHAQRAKRLRAETNRLIQDEFNELRQQLEFLLACDQARLVSGRMVYPHNSGHNHSEPPIGWMLIELVEARIQLINKALLGHKVDQVCAPERTFTMYEYDLRNLCGTSAFTEEEVAQLVTSCAGEYLTVFQLDNVRFEAMASMFDDIFYLKVSMPVFP